MPDYAKCSILDVIMCGYILDHVSEQRLVSEEGLFFMELVDYKHFLHF
jgi:hypothetical protein